MVIISDLEKECPKTNIFKFFFEKLRTYAKYVCPVKKNDQKDYDRDMKAKPYPLLLLEGQYSNHKNKGVQSTTTNSSSCEDSTSGKRSSSNRSSSGSSFKDTTGSSSYFGSPKGTGTSFTDTIGGNSISPNESPTKQPIFKLHELCFKESSVAVSQNSAIKVMEIEAKTSIESYDIRYLDKKCPQKEEYKVFFEKLKGTMTGSSKVSNENKKGFFSRKISAAGKLSDAMAFMRSRIGSKSADVLKNQGKKGGSLTCKPRHTKKRDLSRLSPTQFVETAIQSESSSTSSSSSFSSNLQGKLKVKAN
ncbi:hypothetical protein EUTSA_v10009470mg [Eutrema salsugineum]|uniref:DUF1216 domain-containing protein n=1 Tax=Eutrema salsugineum TaxID=72664 RepID=V4KUX9_EUTSA|nr:hypothetical protein EUTSA_v10009470mg [Eutrema salsugineum]